MPAQHQHAVLQSNSLQTDQTGLRQRQAAVRFKPHKQYRRAHRQHVRIILFAQRLYLGMDFGTSGARAAVIDGTKRQLFDAETPYQLHSTAEWEGALWDLLQQLPPELRSHITSIAVDGTTTTCVLTDTATGRPLAPPKLYTEAQDDVYVQMAAALAPENHSVVAPISSLCKLLCWAHDPTLPEAHHNAVVLSHAEWVASLLHGRLDTADAHSAVRLGYDPEAERFPDWLTLQPCAGLLPSRVLAPGSPIACISGAVARKTGLPMECIVCAGTVDGAAAFIASGLSQPGEAVTSLGSTLAIDLLSSVQVDSAANGVTSYRMGDAWIVDGGSNTGGLVLRRFFTDRQLAELSERIIDPLQPSGLDYYPLLSPGQRFPVTDPGMQPRLAPRPDDDVLFLHGLLEGIANIEAQAYSILADLGATPVQKVYTAGGGSVNQVWARMRQANLGVPVLQSPRADAAYGAALLALAGASGQ